MPEQAFFCWSLLFVVLAGWGFTVFVMASWFEVLLNCLDAFCQLFIDVWVLKSSEPLFETHFTLDWEMAHFFQWVISDQFHFICCLQRSHNRLSSPLCSFCVCMNTPHHLHSDFSRNQNKSEKSHSSFHHHKEDAICFFLWQQESLGWGFHCLMMMSWFEASLLIDTTLHQLSVNALVLEDSKLLFKIQFRLDWQTAHFFWQMILD